MLLLQGFTRNRQNPFRPMVIRETRPYRVTLVFIVLDRVLPSFTGFSMTLGRRRPCRDGVPMPVRRSFRHQSVGFTALRVFTFTNRNKINTSYCWGLFLLPVMGFLGPRRFVLPMLPSFTGFPYSTWFNCVFRYGSRPSWYRHGVENGIPWFVSAYHV